MKGFKKLAILILMLFSLTLVPNVYAEEGIIGEYDTEEEAQIVAEKNAVENEDELVETEVVVYQREYVEDEKSFNEIFSTRIGALGAAQLLKLTYQLKGYDVSDAKIETVVITESSTEEKTFYSLSEIQVYKSLLELEGNAVDIRITNLGLTTTETNQQSVDYTASSLLELFGYMLSLVKDHNRFNIKFEDASYVITTDEDISVYFDTEEEALEYIEYLRNNYTVTNDEITYHEQTTDREEISDLFDNLDSAQNFSNELNEDEYLNMNDESIKELTTQDIDIDEVLNNPNFDYLNSEEEKKFSTVYASASNKVNVKYFDSYNGVVETTGTLRNVQIYVNNEAYSLSLSNPYSQNSLIKITGEVCTKTNILGVCTGKLFSFETNGIVSGVNIETVNLMVYSTNVFNYKMNSIDFTGEVPIIDDNLVHVYKYVGFNEITYNETYEVTAHIYDEEVVKQMRVYGDVSKINVLPVIDVEITKTKDVTKYQMEMVATKTSIKEVYAVEYTRTLKEKIVEPVSEKVEYVILSGDNQTLLNGADLVIKASGNIEKFIKLLMDNVEIPAEYYSVESGSTIATIKGSYLDTLSRGNHKVTFVYDDGEVSATVKLANSVVLLNNVSNPQTLDKANLYFILLATSFVSLIVVVYIKKRIN